MVGTVPPKDGNAEGFDIEAYEEAKAALEGWMWSPWKGFVKGDQVWVETNSIDGRWEPVSAQNAAETTVPTAECRAMEPTVDSWLVHTLTPRLTKPTADEERAETNHTPCSSPEGHSGTSQQNLYGLCR